MDSLSRCLNSIESTILFFLHCANYTFQKQTLLNKIRYIDSNILTQKETSVTLLFGKSDFKYSLNKEIINATIGLILSTERFICPLF